MRYAVYAVPENAAQTTACRDARYLLGLSYSTNYSIPTIYRTGYTYAVSIVDRYGNEYAPLFMGATAGTSEAVTLNTPINNGTAIGNYEFTWSSVADASYYIDIARDDLFTDLILAGNYRYFFPFELSARLGKRDLLLADSYTKSQLFGRYLCRICIPVRSVRNRISDQRSHRSVRHAFYHLDRISRRYGIPTRNKQIRRLPLYG